MSYGGFKARVLVVAVWRPAREEGGVGVGLGNVRRKVEGKRGR